MNEYSSYAAALAKAGDLSPKSIDALSDAMRQHFSLKPVPAEVLAKGDYGPKVTANLTRLRLAVADGHRSWRGIVVGFPGSRSQLSTSRVGTPYLRKILYPILEVRRRLEIHLVAHIPCLYLLGERFSDVFLRKFNLLSQVFPHVIVLTQDLLTCSRSTNDASSLQRTTGPEAALQKTLCTLMAHPDGLRIPVGEGAVTTGFLAYEVPTSEGTVNPERLDILGYDTKDHSLVAIELKARGCGRVEVENLFLQGMEHRNWLENNKMALKLLFDGPRGGRINTRKRVRLVLGFDEEHPPDLFHNLRAVATQKDKHMKVDFVRMTFDSGNSDELTMTRV